jgi:hypothetical protein
MGAGETFLVYANRPVDAGTKKPLFEEEGFESCMIISA